MATLGIASRTGLAAIGIWAAAVLLPGCDSGPRVVPVSGTVLIDGKPLTHGVVQVIPDGGRAAVGDIQSDGRFTLTTFKSNDGCILGEHRVAIIAHETLGAGSQRWHAPKKYIDPTTSELTAAITGPTNDLTLSLTWGDEKPFVETFGRE